MPSDPRGVDRRRFIKLGAAASGLALSGCSSNPPDPSTTGPLEMRYRPLGNTGLQVSEVSFGAHGLDNPALLPAAIDAGITTFATSGNYLDGREEEALGDAMAQYPGRRDEIVVITGETVRPGTSRESILQSIDDSLRRLRTDRIEVYCTAAVRQPHELGVDALFEAFDIARQAGKVRHLAFSGHSGGMQACLETAIADGRYEVFFVKYDFASYPDQDEILQRAARQGVGTLVFKTNAGNRQREIRDLEASGLSFRQASVKWALSHPYVSSVCVAFTNFDEIREYTAASGSALAAAEVEMLRRYTGEMYDKYCRFCGSCEASCPHGVAVADVMRFAMYFKYYGREKSAMRQYDALRWNHSAAACARCDGPCDGGCPFGRPVRTELVEAHKMLSFDEA